MRRLGNVAVFAWVAIGMFACAPSCVAIQFIPFSPGFAVVGVSGDGSTVVGNNYYVAFRWTLAGGMEMIPDLESADAVSFDGSKIAGITPGESSILAIWTKGGGVQPVLTAPANTYFEVRGISADGGVVVGNESSTVNPGTPIRWDPVTGLETIPIFIRGTADSSNAISGDGKYIVGSLGNSAFEWTRTTGPVDLGGDHSAAWGVSADGSVVIGYDGEDAVRWTNGKGMQTLGPFPGAISSFARGVTADGSTIVGNVIYPNGSDAFIWTEKTGAENLTTLLEQNGVDLRGWTFTGASATSNDGRVIVGFGTDPQGLARSWIVIIPEPGSLALVLVGMSGAVVAGRRPGRCATRNSY